MKDHEIVKLQNRYKSLQDINPSMVFQINISQLQLVITVGDGFSNIREKYENVVFIIKNPRNRNENFVVKFNPLNLFRKLQSFLVTYLSYLLLTNYNLS